MIALRKRGKGFHADMLVGETRVRGSLGTRNQDAARRLIHKLEAALADPLSLLWPELGSLLPRGTFARFADFAGVKERQLPMWEQLQESFKIYMEQRIKIGKLRESTVARYQHTLREFELFLAEEKVSLLKDVTSPFVENFKVWRVERIKKRKHSRGATGIVLDAAIMHRVFSFAVKRKMVSENPVLFEGTPGENPEGGAEPFSPHELSLLRKHVEPDLLAFLLLRWTGLRGSDAVTLRWCEVQLERKEIERVTQKRRKKVILPIHSELLFALELERDRRHPKPSDPVLLNPATGRAMTRPRLYERIRAMGERAGVTSAHPHRFRDTLAVDMLVRGASPYDVAKMLGDTIETVEKHYTPFVKELRERVRNILETGVGLEELEQKTAEPLQTTSRKPN
jgi:integrase